MSFKKKLISVLLALFMVMTPFLDIIGVSKVQAATTYVWEKFNSDLTQEYRAYSMSSLGEQFGGRTVYPTMNVDKKTGIITLGGTPYYSEDSGYYEHSPGRSVVYRYVSRESCGNWDGCYQEFHNSIVYGSRLEPVYVKGESTKTFVTSTSQYTYPSDRRHTDGFWYVSLGANTEPVLSVTQSTAKTISLKPGSDTFTISGTVSDAENDNVTVSAKIGNVEKQVAISGTRTAKAWSLVWRTSEFSSSGNYTGIQITATDSKSGVSSTRYNGSLNVNITPLYYWDKFSTKDQTSSYTWKIETTYNSYVDSIKGYRDFNFDAGSGQFIGVGEFDIYPTYPTWAGNHLYDIYNHRMYAQMITNGQGVEHTVYVAVPGTVKKIKNALVQSNILDIDKTYPNDGLHSDGFWYVKKETTNMAPVLTVDNSDILIGSASEKITLKGKASDSDGDKISISASIDDVTKTTSITGSGDWQLEWSVSEIAEGRYNNIKITGDDGKQGVDTISYSGSIIFDLIPPEKPKVTLSDDTWTNEDVTLYATPGSDIGSGIDYTEYTMDGETWINYTQPVVISDSGAFRYQLRTVDKAGNVGETTEVLVRVDKVAPSAPEMTLSEEGYTQNPVTISFIDGTDELSGVERTEVKVGTGNWKTIHDDVVVDEEGETEIRARTVDIAGNISPEETAKVLIDRTAPTEPHYRLSESQWTQQDVTFELSGSQDASEVTYEYKIDDGSYTEGDKGTVTESGEHTITARAVDAVGLVSPEVQFKVRIDKDIPKVEFAPNGQQWASQGTDVEIKATDALSGVQEPLYFEISQNEQPSGSWQMVLNDEKVKIEDTEGTWYVHTQVMDKAGNVGKQTSNPYQVQNAPDAASLQATALSASEIRLNWDLPSGDRYTAGYTYILKNMNTGTEKMLEYPVHEYVDQHLQGGKTYNYQLTVRNHVGAAESETSALTYPDSPGVEISPIYRTPGEMLIHIDSVPTATDYRLKLIDPQGQTQENEINSSTQRVLTGLNPGSTYTVQVSAINESGESSATSLGFLTLPETPTGFTAIEIKKDSVSTEWESVTSATYYDLYRNNELLYNGGDRSYKDSVLTSGTEYEYVVAAGNETGEGDVSDPLHVMTLPEQDHSLHMNSFSTTGFTAQWNGVPSAILYHLQVFDLEQNVVAEYKGSSLEYTTSGLLPGTEYNVSLVAYNRTGAGEENVVRTVTLPSVVETVDVGAIGETEAAFNFSSVAGASSYKIVLNDEEFLTTDLTYVLSALKGSTEYTGTVQAGNSSGWSEPTSFSFLTKPLRPLSLTVKSFSENDMILSWDGDNTASKYWITNEQGDTTALTEPEFAVMDLQPGTEYRFKVAAENATGMGLASEIVWSTRTDAPEVDQLEVQNLEASLSWTEPFGAMRFVIQDEASGKEYYNGSQPIAHLSDLEPGQVYGLMLYAFNKMDAKSKGTPVKLVTRATLSESHVKFTDVKSESVTIEIEKAGQEIQNYAILRDGVEIAQVGAGNIVSYTDKDVEPGRSYVYEIVPINQSGNGAGIQVSTMTATLPVVDPEVKSGDGWAEIKFPVVAQATEYVILDHSGAELWRGDTMPIRLDNLVQGKEYALEIIAENTLGHPSSPLSVSVWTLPKAPMGIDSNSTETSVTIEFSDENSKGYVIYKAGKVVAHIKAGEKSWTDKNLSPNTNYRYEVRSVNPGGESMKGIVVEQRTQQEQLVNPINPSAPTSASIQDQGKDKGKLEIDKSKDQNKDIGSQKEDNQSELASGSFMDVSDSSFAKNEIETLAKDGVIKGVSSNLFAPNKQITRIEFAALIVRVLNAKADESITMTFNDVKDSAWYMEELNAAVANGIAKGFSSHEFRPNTTVNREQAAKMLVNVLGSKGLTLQKSDHKFMDESEIATWAAEDVKIAAEQKFVQGYPDNSFRPKNGLTRAEAAVMIYRFRLAINPDMEL